MLTYTIISTISTSIISSILVTVSSGSRGGVGVYKIRGGRVAGELHPCDVLGILIDIAL